MKTQLDTTNWQEYKFEVNGVKFISKIDTKGDLYPRIEKLPEGMFIQWQYSMVNELIGDVANMSKDELESHLDRVNDGATQAIVALA